MYNSMFWIVRRLHVSEHSQKVIFILKKPENGLFFMKLEELSSTSTVRLHHIKMPTKTRFTKGVCTDSKLYFLLLRTLLLAVESSS